MTHEPILIISIQTATILLFVLAYNIFNPTIKFAEESEYSDIFKKYRKTGRAMVKRYYFNELFLQVIIIGTDHIKKYYYVKKRNGIYKKLFQKFKVLKNETKIFKNKAAEKSGN
jgi:hypothetical protein